MVQSRMDNNVAALRHETAQAHQRIEGKLARIETRLAQKRVKETSNELRVSRSTMSSARSCAENMALKIARISARLNRLAETLQRRLIFGLSILKDSLSWRAFGLGNTTACAKAALKSQFNLHPAADFAFVGDVWRSKSRSSTMHDRLLPKKPYSQDDIYMTIFQILLLITGFAICVISEAYSISHGQELPYDTVIVPWLGEWPRHLDSQDAAMTSRLTNRSIPISSTPLGLSSMMFIPMS